MAGFVVSCGAVECSFDERSARLDVRAEEPQFSKTAGSASPALVGNNAVAANRGIGDEGFASRTELVVGFVSDLSSDAAADFEFESNKLSVGLELTARLGAVVELDLEGELVSRLTSAFVSSFAPDFVTTSAPNSEPDFAAVAAWEGWAG